MEWKELRAHISSSVTHTFIYILNTHITSNLTKTEPVNNDRKEERKWVLAENPQTICCLS